MMVLNEYFKTYGEQIYHIISTERKEAIANDFEVTIERFNFLPPAHCRNIQEYLRKSYF